MQFKKILKASMTAMLCAVTFTSMTACSNTNNTNTAQETTFETPQLLLNAAWEKMDEAEKPSIMGGVAGNTSMDEPMAVDMNDKETLSSALSVPESLIEASDKGASMMNAMMANYFTASAWQVKEESKIDGLAKDAMDYLKNNQWLCATPESFAVLQAGKDLVVVYGLESVVKAFDQAVQAADPSAKILHEGALD